MKKGPHEGTSCFRASGSRIEEPWIPPIEQRGLRLVGDPIRQADEALGEIVGDLEFELRNPPGIEDCSAFLEAVGPLRAMLLR